MSWIFRIFFGIIGLCIIIAALYGLRNLLAREQSCKAVVKQRSKKVFPVSYGGKRRDRSECKVTFLLADSQKELTFDVKEKLYDQLPRGTVGTLTWKGSWLKDFRTE